MGDVFKELIRGTGEKFRSPQVLGLIVIILLIFRSIFNSEFVKLMIIFTNGLGKLEFLINVFQLISVMLFICSSIAFIVAIFFTITYLAIEIISDKKKNLSENFLNYSDTIHRFFIGSKIAVMNVNMWLIVASCYFYLFDEVNFCKYKGYTLNFIIQTNILIKVISALYVIVIFISIIKLFEKLIYKFLYFRLDDETEKKLYEIKKDFQA